MFAMTAAHKRLPIPTWVRVTNLDNHKQVVVKVNDRGPFHKGRIIDLSYVAARRLGIVGEGSAPVRIRTVTPATINQLDPDQGSPDSANPPVPLRRAENPPVGPDEDNNAAASPVANRRSPAPAPSAARHDNAAPLQIGAFSTADHASLAKARARAAGVGPVAMISTLARHEAVSCPRGTVQLAGRPGAGETAARRRRAARARRSNVSCVAYKTLNCAVIHRFIHVRQEFEPDASRPTLVLVRRGPAGQRRRLGGRQ